MLTRVTIRNFKRFEEVEVELGSPVVFIGPNNSGKTSAMQALALWQIGLGRWNEKYAGKSAPEKRSGVTVNRRDLLAIPHPKANLLWRRLHVRDVRRFEGRQRTKNIRIDLLVEGVKGSRAWKCGLEFDYANEESFYCRPLRIDEGAVTRRMPIPYAASDVRIAFLPPISGLAANETRLDQGAVNVRLGEGRTAEILRNLCLHIQQESAENWSSLVQKIEALFGAKIQEPQYIEARGEISMNYCERGTTLDISSSGRGLQQTLLILAYIYANPGTVILLDEPDAHLEILRQRQIFNLITEVASKQGNQIIAASHSEVLLNEAADKNLVIAFVGKPHRIGSRGSQVRKALVEIGFDQYYQAEQTGWVLYLEGSTDLAMLQAFARRLRKEEAVEALDKPFVHYVGNNLKAAESHYYGLREAIPKLRGVTLFDRLGRDVPEHPALIHLVWERREFENYLCTQVTLEAYAQSSAMAEESPLFAATEVNRRLIAMREAIAEVRNALRVLGKDSPWDNDVKVSDEFLAPVFDAYFNRLDLPNLMKKKNFYELADFVPDDEIVPEIGEKLDKIAKVAANAVPGTVV